MLDLNGIDFAAASPALRFWVYNDPIGVGILEFASSSFNAVGLTQAMAQTFGNKALRVDIFKSVMNEKSMHELEALFAQIPTEQGTKYIARRRVLPCFYVYGANIVPAIRKLRELHIVSEDDKNDLCGALDAPTPIGSHDLAPRHSVWRGGAVSSGRSPHTMMP